MDENKRDPNKARRNKNDYVKLALTSYLQKRNFPYVHITQTTTQDFLLHSFTESEASRPNSVLYSCYNSDPVVIDHTFTKFVFWLKDLVRNKKICHDLECLVPPLFCHLYLDILKGGHSERAATFFKVHSPSIERLKLDDLVKNLMLSFANDNAETSYKDVFRGNKYSLNLSQQSVQLLKKYVAENCHVVFLQELQNWFDIQETDEDSESVNGHLTFHAETKNSKFIELKNVIRDLNNEPKPVFCVNISGGRAEINNAVIRRTSGIIAYSQQSVVHVKPIHPYNSIFYHKDYKELSFHGHHGKVYAITISEKCEYLITASSDSNVCIFDLLNSSLQCVCKGHLGPVYCVAVNYPACFVASGSYDTTARLWSTDKGQMLRVFIGHSQPVTCIEFHPNNVYLVTGSADRTLRLWNVESGKTERLFQYAKGIIFAVAIHPCGQYLASSSDDKRIHIWDISNTKLMIELKYKEDLVTKLVWSTNGKHLAAGSINGVFRLWDFDGIQENNSVEAKVFEPCLVQRLNSKLLDIEYSCNGFTCVTSSWV